jgi:integrase
MQGSVTRRGPSWSIRISNGFDPVTGRRVQITRTVRGSKRDAEKALTQLLHERDNGIDLSPGRVTLGAFLVQWLEDARPSLRPRTHLRYQELVNHVIPALGTRPFERLRPADVSGLYASLSGKLAPRTVGHVHRVLHRALGDAVRWGLIARNVTEAVRPPRVPQAEMVALSPVQARRLLDAAAGDRSEALYVLALSVGLRQGELLGLKWGDADLDARSLQIRRSLSWVPGVGAVEQEPKSARSRRTVLLGATAVESLRRHRARQAEYRLRTLAYDDHDLVFPNALGRWQTPQNLIQRSFHPLLERAGLPRIAFHSLRHTAASLMLSQGIDIRTISATLGHSTVALTLDVYAHLMPGMREDAAEKMDKLLAAAR